MSLVDNVRDFFQSETARNKTASVVAGFLFFLGWWILIDGLSTIRAPMDPAFIIIGIFGTLSMFMVNTVKNSHLSEDNVSATRARAAKAWLLIGFAMGFASVVAAIWVTVERLQSSASKYGTWTIVAVLLQNLFILLANLTFKLGRNEESWGTY